MIQNYHNHNAVQPIASRTLAAPDIMNTITVKKICSLLLTKKIAKL